MVQVDGYVGDQLVNAAAIIQAATALHLNTDAAVLAVTAAMGESSLHDLPSGDAAINPDGTPSDSIGLFQQQHWWGSRLNRMTPTSAATAFLTQLQTIPGWEAMTPSAAIHAVQHNADPDHYTRYYPAALDIVTALATTAKLTPLAASTQSPADALPKPWSPTGGWASDDVRSDINSNYLTALTAAGAAMSGPATR